MKLKTNYMQAVLISLPFFAITMFWQAYDTIMPQILAYHFGMSKTFLGAVMGLDNLIALAFLPLFGIWSDKINSKHGRRTPFIFWGTLGGALSFVFLSIADNLQLTKLDNAQISQRFATADDATKTVLLHEITEIVKSDLTPFIILMIALLLGVFMMSIFRAPAVALTADTFIRPQRSTANAVLTILGGLAGVVFLVLNKKMATLFGGQVGLMIVSAIIMVIAIFAYVGLVNENKLVAQMQQKSIEMGLADETTSGSGTVLTGKAKTSFYFILVVVVLMYMGYNGYSTHFSVYAIEHLNMTASSLSGPLLVRVVAVLVFSIPAAILSTKIGRNNCSRYGLIIAGISLLSTYFLNESSAKYLSLIFIIFAFGFALVSINVGPMLMELCKDGDVGKYTGYYYLATAIAQIVTPALAGFFADTFGYQTLPIYGTVFMLLGSVATLYITQGNSKPVFVSASAALAHES